MTCPVPLRDGWRDHITVDERNLSNQWSMFGDRCISKVGKRWDSHVPAAPYFKTKKAAYEFLSRFVCDMIPLRCMERMDHQS